MSNNINHPKHYNVGNIEPISVIEDWKLGFNLGNTIKYIARAEHKNSKLEDLKKAKWYLDRECNKVESEENIRLKEIDKFEKLMQDASKFNKDHNIIYKEADAIMMLAQFKFIFDNEKKVDEIRKK